MCLLYNTTVTSWALRTIPTPYTSTTNIYIWDGRTVVQYSLLFSLLYIEYNKEGTPTHTHPHIFNHVHLPVRNILPFMKSPVDSSRFLFIPCISDHFYHSPRSATLKISHLPIVSHKQHSLQTYFLKPQII